MRNINSISINLKIYNLTSSFVILLILFTSGCQITRDRDELFSIAKDYDWYVETRLATMQKEKMPYIHLELCTSGQAPRTNVSYLIFRKDDDKFYFEKTTVHNKYVARQLPKEEYNKYFDILISQDDYDCFSDTTISGLNTIPMFYKVNRFDGKVSKKVTLSDFQVIDDTTLPAVAFIRTFIFDRHWEEMKELYQKK